MDHIRWERASDGEAAVVVHKVEDEDFPNGSDLIVGASQMAVLTNGVDIVAFTDVGLIKLEEGDPLFAPFRSTSGKRGAGLHGTVYFVDTTEMTELRWGMPTPIMVRLPVEQADVRVRTVGMFSAHIEQGDTTQVGKFLRKVMGSRTDLTQEELVSFMRARIQEQVSGLLSDTIVRKNSSLVKLPAYMSDITETIRGAVQEAFEEVGLTLDKFTLQSINVQQEDLRMIQEAERQRLLQQMEQKKKQVPSERRCPSCGDTVSATAKFCTECGTKL
ncbi:MAG: SPFH domain-containing protein [Oscillospiraceae bacterium]|nr:SPFH domain-containing protein [Oscillospiraceae bacterium]